MASAIEIGFDLIEKKAETVVPQKKIELREELAHELATKEELQCLEAATKADLKNLEMATRTDSQLLRSEMQPLRVDLEARVNGLNQKLNFMTTLMILALTRMNPVAADLIKNAIG